MLSTTSLLSTILLAATALAAPTGTTYGAATSTVAATGVTHSVVAGLGGLKFEPNNVVAEVGDIVEFHFLPKNHSVAQSSFADPCMPLPYDGSFFSGFNFVTAENQAPDVFQITVNDTKPIWYYCAQTTGNHCQNGMAGVINQDSYSANTLSAYLVNAAKSGVSVAPAVIQGGWIEPNPNPTSGFKL
jgi:plastocyanin